MHVEGAWRHCVCVCVCVCWGDLDFSFSQVVEEFGAKGQKFVDRIKNLSSVVEPVEVDLQYFFVAAQARLYLVAAAVLLAERSNYGCVNPCLLAACG